MGTCPSFSSYFDPKVKITVEKRYVLNIKAKMSYTNEEYADMIFLYGFCNGISTRARDEYRQRYPHRSVPSSRTFTCLFQRLRETGRLQRSTSSYRRTSGTSSADLDQVILTIFENDPETSIRSVANRLNVSTYKVWSILKTYRQHPYHFIKVQELLPADKPKRLQFCHWILEKYIHDRDYVKNIFWTDESNFSRAGVLNLHNQHFWASANPHQTRTASHQTKFSVNVWAGVLGNELIGPFRLPTRLGSCEYLQFLKEEIEDFLDNLSLRNLCRITYQHDGAPAHYGRRVKDWLDRNFPGRYIARNGPIHWPARSPDLNPLDFFVWGRIKELVYSSDVNSLEVLNQRIDAAAEQVRADLSNMDVAEAIAKRAVACISAEGSNFEQLL